MSYNFREFERKIYPRTFLKDVHVKLLFDKPTSAVSGLADFFQEHFNIQLQGIESGHHTINSADGLITYIFAFDSVELIMRRPAYRDFSLTQHLMPTIKHYLEILGVIQINKMFISKYNELNYKDEGGLDVVSIMKSVFSKEMLSFGSAETANKYEIEKIDLSDMTRWEKFGTFSGDDSWNSLFNFEYGFSRRANDTSKGYLTLFTSIESNDQVLKVQDIDDVASYFNDILDRGFHWCVNENIIAKMKEQ